MPRALLTTSDKSGLVPFARALVEAGWELVSTGGTARALRAEALPVTEVAEITGFPEVLDGRVKTLHPHVHAGVLARAGGVDDAALQDLGIAPFDLVAANLYPFRDAVAGGELAAGEAVEWIDVGGPTLLRAAAKTFERVTVVVDPGDYERVAASLRVGGPDAAERRRLARKAFAHTAAYDAAIVSWLDTQASEADEATGHGNVLDAEDVSDTSPFPPTLHPALLHAGDLRYGENPHQRAARYRFDGVEGAWDACVQHKGSPLGFSNVMDAEAAARLAHAFDVPAAVIVKHGNPCGAAQGEDLAAAYARAFAGDPSAAFGGVVALNRSVDEATAEALMANPKADVVIAPGFASDALGRLGARRKAMRVLEAPAPRARPWDARLVDGGVLLQEADRVPVDEGVWRVATRREPSEAQWRELRFAWRVCAATASNAVVLTRGGMAVGVGAGQQSRVDASALAVRKAGDRAAGAVAASDGFFPFRDGMEALAQAGVEAVIQPGGSVRDEEVVDAADAYDVAMVTTGERHFRH